MNDNLKSILLPLYPHLVNLLLFVVRIAFENVYLNKILNSSYS